tara:strand:+ start:943 stop:1707 length:765 start_codon:yes stop_codon:yes gene_type:complete
MNILLTNDDGIDSPFVRPLAKALSKVGKVTIATPAYEQSWIGKGMSRFKDVELKQLQGYDNTCYTLSGTPGDCVNIAIGHLLDERPDWVVSGINIGHNSGLAFVAASGTVAGAMEACLHGIPSIAASMYLPPEVFNLIKDDKSSPLTEETIRFIDQACEYLARFVKDTPTSDSYGRVNNFNFPYTNLEQAETRRTVVGHTMTNSLFARQGDTFTFDYKDVTERPNQNYSDRQCIMDGNISLTHLDYCNISKTEA